jgi:hypothetical protein
MDCLDPILSVYKAIILVSICTSIVCSSTDIEYNHDVAGTGTVMTDYIIGDEQGSEASGAIHVTGDVINSFSFSSNNSTNLIERDRFVFTKTTSKAVTMAVAPRFPPWTGNLSSYRLIGRSWADKIELASHVGPSTNNGSNAEPT